MSSLHPHHRTHITAPTSLHPHHCPPQHCGHFPLALEPTGTRDMHLPLRRSGVLRHVRQGLEVAHSPSPPLLGREVLEQLCAGSKPRHSGGNTYNTRCGNQGELTRGIGKQSHTTPANPCQQNTAHSHHIRIITHSTHTDPCLPTFRDRVVSVAGGVAVSITTQPGMLQNLTSVKQYVTALAISHPIACYGIRAQGFTTTPSCVLLEHHHACRRLTARELAQISNSTAVHTTPPPTRRSLIP